MVSVSFKGANGFKNVSFLVSSFIPLMTENKFHRYADDFVEACLDLFDNWDSCNKTKELNKLKKVKRYSKYACLANVEKLEQYIFKQTVLSITF